MDELFRSAIGNKNTNYYLDVFKNLKEGNYRYALWNWGAFFFGPFWMIYRRFNIIEICIRSYMAVLACLYSWNLFSFPINIGIMLFVYCFIFPVTVNIIYFYKINSLIKKNSSLSRNEINSVLRKKFRTEFEVINERIHFR